MNSKNATKISQAAPSVFYTTLEGANTNQPFYFECNDGWAELLYEAAVKLNEYIQTLPNAIKEDIVALQVKEKYGTLRFYVSYYSPEIDQIVKDAEDKSRKTCEVCGKEGSLRGKMWLYTACDEHTRKEDLQELSENKLP